MISSIAPSLRLEFDCEIDQEQILDRMDGAIDETWELEAAYDWMREQASGVPGFEVEPRLVLAV